MSERVNYIDVDLIYDLWNEYAAAMEECDLDRWISLWIDNAIELSPDRPPLSGKEQISHTMRVLFDRYVTITMAINPEEVRIIGDWALTHGTFSVERMPRVGGRKISCAGTFVGILEKQVDCTWKIAIDYRNHDDLY